MQEPISARQSLKCNDVADAEVTGKARKRLGIADRVDGRRVPAAQRAVDRPQRRQELGGEAVGLRLLGILRVVVCEVDDVLVTERVMTEGVGQREALVLERAAAVEENEAPGRPGVRTRTRFGEAA